MTWPYARADEVPAACQDRETLKNRWLSFSLPCQGERVLSLKKHMQPYGYRFISPWAQLQAQHRSTHLATWSRKLHNRSDLVEVGA